MNLVLDDNLNMILTEGSGYLLNDACELDRIEGNNSKIPEKHGIPLIKKNWLKIHVLCILENEPFTIFSVVPS